MRIAHITATFPPYYTGTGNVCYHNARVLAERGHDVQVYTAAWPGTPDDPEGVIVHRMQPKLRIGNAPLLPQLSGLHDLDIIHLHYPFIFGAEFVTLAAWTHRIPLVLTYHNDLIAPGARGLLFMLYERSVTRGVLRLAKHVYAVSEAHAASSSIVRRIATRRPYSVLPVPNGVDTKLFHPAVQGRPVRKQFHIPDEATVIAFVGGLDAAHYFKRVDVLIRAVAASDQADLHLLIVGGGDSQASYEELARQTRIINRCHFTGPIPHRALPPYVAACDMLALPSDGVESFGLVLVEAMACAKPVVASDLPGVRSVVSDGQDGLLAVPGDVDDLRRKIEHLSNDPRLRRTMGQRGRLKVMEHYSWDRIGEQLESLYMEVLGEAVVVFSD